MTQVSSLVHSFGQQRDLIETIASSNHHLILWSKVNHAVGEEWNQSAAIKTQRNNWITSAISAPISTRCNSRETEFHVGITLTELNSSEQTATYS